MCIAFALLLVPSLAFGASFANRSLFLSKTPVVEGESVFIHAIVSNDANTRFSGKLIIRDAESEIGSVAVALEAQSADVVSISWKPSAGRYSLTAELAETDGTVVETESATFSIDAKPSETAEEASETSVGSSENIQESIANFSPEVASAAKPVFSTLDSFRETAAGAIDNGKSWAKNISEGKSSVLGASSSVPSEEAGGLVSAVSRLIASLIFYIFSFLSYLIKNPALFYPVFAIAFLYGLYRLYKRMRRPSFDV